MKKKNTHRRIFFQIAFFTFVRFARCTVLYIAAEYIGLSIVAIQFTKQTIILLSSEFAKAFTSQHFLFQKLSDMIMTFNLG